MSSISFIASYSTSASANSTFMCPGMRPATGWIAYLTSTPLRLEQRRHLLDRVLGLRHGQTVAGHDDDLVGVRHLDRGIGGRGGLTVPWSPPSPAAASPPPPKEPNTIAGIDRFIATAIRLVRIDARRADDHARDDHRGVVQRQTRCRGGQTRQRVEQRDDHRHVGAADREAPRTGPSHRPRPARPTISQLGLPTPALRPM